MSKIYLSVPAGSEGDVTQMPAKDFEEYSRTGDAIKVLMGRKEIKADPDQLREQIAGHIDVVKAVIRDSEEVDSPMKIKSVKLGLTVTVKGNIGLASAGAEASIEIEFSR